MDEADFRGLYLELKESVFGFAARRLSADQAADVVSETFETAWRKRATFPADRDEWAPWLFGIARNKVLQESQRRRRKHHDNRFIEDHRLVHQRSGVDVAEEVADSAQAVAVYRALTPADQLLFDIAHVRELGKDGAAQVLGITVTAYTTRLTRLRQRIVALRAEQDQTDEARGGERSVR